MTLPAEWRDCCHAWDTNTTITETQLVRAVYDAYPVTPGHTLIYPKQHVDRYHNLTPTEASETFTLIQQITTTGNWTIGINDGPLAGRTIPHLHIHCIPRRHGDTPNPAGGIRQLLTTPHTDPWLNQ